MKSFPLLFLLFGFFFINCHSNSKPSSLPNTPEAVVRAWQAFIDNNQLSQAAQLSTAEALIYIQQELSALPIEDSLEQEQNVFLDLQCQELGDSAICTYFFEDEIGEKMPGKLALRRIKGQWLVSKTDFDTDTNNLDSLPTKLAPFSKDTSDDELE